MVFCNRFNSNGDVLDNEVTILILIDGFLQYGKPFVRNLLSLSHNPYFNRWFSAIYNRGVKRKKEYCHNPYFNRWFSAI